jgi:hypothetical protein
MLTTVVKGSRSVPGLQRALSDYTFAAAATSYSLVVSVDVGAVCSSTLLPPDICVGSKWKSA